MAGGASYNQSQVVLDSIQEVSKEGFANRDFQKLMKCLTVGSTTRLVSNCEDVTDWDISDSASFNAVDETTIIKTGSAAMELVDVTSTVGAFVTLDSGHKPNGEDWSQFGWVVMWVEDGASVRTATELYIQISNAGEWQTAIAVPVCTTADKFEMKCISIDGVDRGSVDGFRFVSQRATGSSEKVYIDNIMVTDMIASVGDATACAVGPVRGSSFIFPIASGATILPGQIINFEKCEATTGVNGDDALIGVACQVYGVPYGTGSKTASDTAYKEIIVLGAGGLVNMRIDGSGATSGDGALIASGDITVGDATTSLKETFGKFIETAEANADNMVQLHGGRTET